LRVHSAFRRILVLTMYSSTSQPAVLSALKYWSVNMGGRYKHRVRVYGHSRQAQTQRVERLTWQLSSQAGQPLVGKPLGSNDEEVLLVLLDGGSCYPSTSFLLYPLVGWWGCYHLYTHAAPGALGLLSQLCCSLPLVLPLLPLSTVIYHVIKQLLLRELGHRVGLSSCGSPFSHYWVVYDGTHVSIVSIR
jgi:hypothetical protein